MRVMLVGCVFVYTQIHKNNFEESENESESESESARARKRERERKERESENKCVQSNIVVA